MSIDLKTLKQYSVPITLFAIGLFFQLVILQGSFPPSHYDVLGVKQYASTKDVTEAYNKLSARLSESDTPTTSTFIKARYAYELLTNPLWKRDYDLFGIDEQSHVIEKLKVKYDAVKFSDINLPLLEASSSDTTVEAYNKLSPDTFISSIGGERAMLIQVYSDGSHRCAKFMDSWKRIVSLLEDVSDTGMVEVGDVKLASYFAERKSTQQPFFRNGLPSLVAFPPNCRSSNCYIRYQGDYSVDAIVDWMATYILGLPRILYYTKENLMPKFFAKSGHHKVKVLCFSKTGERAAPFLRKVAADFWAYASFGLVLWRDEDSTLWWNTFNVESSPAMVILKDPGVQPVVHHGSLNNSQFLEMIENNKNQELPQLRSVTSMELGCDAKGYSRAGVNAATWYCVVLAGRPGIELNKMRETVRKAQKVLSVNNNLDGDDKLQAQAHAAGLALKQNRLTFTWLDGEAQKNYCLFYLHSENIQETCGPRGYAPFDVPRMFIIRYKRNITENERITKKKVKTMWNLNQEVDVNLASQLVARYNGSDDVQEITQWISKIIDDGDSRELPYFVDNTPDLVADDSKPVWEKGVFARKSLKHRIQSILLSLHDYMKDPRVGSIFLLAACLSFGTIWLQNSRPGQSTQPETNTKKPRRRKPVAERSTNDGKPASITDAIPKNAYQLLPSDSDSDSE